MAKGSEIIYKRRGHKDKILVLDKEDKKAGTCSLKDSEGKVRVTALPLIADPSAVDPADLPLSYATPAGGAVERAPVTADTEKVAAVLSKAHDPETAVTEDDLKKVNIPTLLAIAEGLEMKAPPASAQSGEIKQAILDAVNPAPEVAGSGEPDLDGSGEPDPETEGPQE